VTQISIIGLDIAKSVFQFEAQNAQGAVVRTERLSRDKLLPAIEKIPATVVAMEACATAHHWARQIRKAATWPSSGWWGPGARRAPRR